jgi:hypothetical protein
MGYLVWELNIRSFKKINNSYEINGDMKVSTNELMIRYKRIIFKSLYDIDTKSFDSFDIVSESYDV